MVIYVKRFVLLVIIGKLKTNFSLVIGSVKEMVTRFEDRNKCKHFSLCRWVADRKYRKLECAYLLCI